MSREKSLQKAIVLSLMLTNIWCGAAYAANGADGADGTNPPPKTDAIGSSGLTADYTDSANNGTDGSKGTSDGSQEIGGGKGGNGGSISASHTVSGTLSGAIAITAAAGSGGKGGDSVYAQGDKNYTFGGSGGSGGNVELGLTVTGAVLDGNQNITLTATGGSGGNGGQSNGYGDTLGSDRNNKGGQGGKGGDASAKGLILTGDAAQTTVTVANITITATGGKGGNNGSSYDAAAIVPGSGGAAAAYGITSVAAGKATITAANITVEAAGGSGGDAGAKNSFFKGDTVPEIDNGGEAKATMAYGLQAQNGEIALTAQAVSVTATGGKGGAGSGSSSVNNNTGFDPSGASLAALKGGVGAAGGAAYAAAFDMEGGTADLQATTVASSAAGGVGGDGGKGAQSYHGDNLDGGTGGAGGVGGTAEARGLSITAGGVTLQAASVVATATGGVGGVGGAGANGYEYGAPQPGNGGNGGQGGNGGNAVARAVYATGGAAELTVAGTITATAIGGVGGVGGNCGNGANFSAVGGAGGNGGIGGTAYAYGVLGSGASNMQVKAADIIVSGIGGDGGMSGSSYKNVVLGRNGGAAEAYGICAMNSMVDITAANIQTTATGGKGGTGSSSSFGSQGAGGDGGNAYAYGVQSSGGTVTAATDKITAKASGGAGGNGGGYIGGTIGAIGSIGAEAKAYGIYVENGAVVHLRAKTTNGTIKIGAKADNAQNTEAYAVYADKATVLFNDNAVLNTSDGSTDDNTVLTYLKDATLGFGGTDANRTVTGGTLKLEGSNTFRVTTDLKSDAADKFTFNSLAAGSSTENQYITVGYDKAFDGSDLTSINGDAVVLTFGELNGQNLNFEGKTSTLDSPLTRFTATPTVETSGNDVKITQIDFGKNPDSDASETAMVGSDAQMALGSMWRIEGNNLMKRMGELRSDKEAAKGGVWARYYRGELSADSAYDRNYSQDYTAFQGGIDKEQDYKGGKLYTGIAINRIDSKAGYTAGSGDLSSTGVGVYTSWLGSKGHYVDVIVRSSKLANDFKLVDLSGNAAKADYDTWAYGISAEYGYRQNLNAGWFVEPQAELSLGRIGSVDYTTSNGVTIKQDSVNSAVVRLGFLGGKEFTIGGRASNAYVKASVLHDFGGNGGATGYYGSDSLALQTGDLTGTWYEVGLGANLGIAKNSNLYFDALKTFGGDLRTDWQFNAGLRFTF
ncbi:autotransporter outer membrane beta-barrel domain-containing protein [Phascolarctobacterium faecium]|uniref:autotransporter outer membrane beta-barrel domain-containing protein n=1 Tax=Phascolarctobacterium faecium TaxID=33025 RepID=UPI002109B576|nr:autotransporter outer membrane beta-barrel domain-containing protein [Phascolarctobacterium faecium]MCQ4907681.1 autotransporter outer membrane beta-barrel domain-containing protein [Phascolarctobacterium faecium]